MTRFGFFLHQLRQGHDFLCPLIVLLASVALTAAADYSERTLRLESRDGIQLVGTVTVPETQSEQTPVVILVHGYGRGRDSMLALTDELAARGLAVVTLDLRGHGASRTRSGGGLYAFPMVPMQHMRRVVDDLRLVLREITNDPQLGRDGIAIAGAAEGALIAAAAGARLSQVDVLALIDLPDGGDLFDPHRDLGLFDRRPVLLVHTSADPSQQRAVAAADFGLGERQLLALESEERGDLLVDYDSEGVTQVANWLAEQLGPEATK